MRWTPIVLSCLWIVGCGSSADNTPVPHKYDDFAPAADPGSPSDDAGEVQQEADTGSASPSESPDAAASPSSEEDSGSSPTPETPDAAAAPPPPVDSGKKADGPSDAGAKVDSSAPPPDTSVTKPDSAVADTHVTKDTSTPKDTHVEDTFTPPEDTGAAIDTAPPPPADTGTAAVDTGTSKPDTGTAPATLIDHEVTFYGWPDNDPPGPAIAYPDVHSSAGGTGTYADPITFATAPGEFANGTILYVPYIKKYVIMEDYCAQCTSDWSSGKRHIDIWMNSNASNTSKLQSCQYSWTRPSMPIEINPPPDREVTTAPLFDTSTAVCRTSP